MLRGLTHYWRMSLAVAAGAAVATAVLTGALLVGDSLNDSLRGLARDRLGAIDLALVAPRPLGEGVASALAAEPGFAERYRTAVPALMLAGSATHGATGARAGGVTVVGVDERFAGLYPPGPGRLDPADLERRPGQLFRSLVVNAALARDLGAAPGDAVVLGFESGSRVPRETLLGERDPAAALETLRLTVTAVLPDRGMGRFALDRGQGLPRLAYLALPVLQDALGRDAGAGRINALFVAARGDAGESPAAGAGLGPLLARALTAGDLGVELVPGPGWVSVESRELVLRPALADAALAAAAARGAAALPVLSYLANSLRVGEREAPYSAVAALDTPVPEAFGELTLADGRPAPPLGDDEVLINRWLADDLGAAAGDELTMSYFVVGADDELGTAEARFRVAGVVAMTGLAADPTLTPEAPGIADADDMAAWDPPFPVDLGRVRPEDEAYWDRYRATPKAFVSLATGQRLWRSRFGELTAIRVAAPEPAPEPASEPGAAAEAPASALGRDLLVRLPPAALGLSFRPVKAAALAAATGATDFSGLFLGFSLFLIVAAALLVGLLFALAVERRAGELGLLLAVGYPVRRVRRRLLAEGAVLAAAGGAAGLLLAVAYARLLIAALGSWWAPLLDSPFLRLAVPPATLAIGFGASLLLVLAVVAGSVRRLRRVPARALLAGSLGRGGGEDGGGKGARRLLWVSLLVTAGLLAAVWIGGELSPGLFFGLGAALSAAGFAAFALWCRRERGGLAAPGAAVLAGMAARNSARNPGRSLLAVVLVGCACFVLVSVAASRRDFRHEELGRDSGAGGFDLLAESSLALRRSPDSREALAELGFSDEAVAEVSAAEIYALRLRPGDDASCRNLYQPERPRLLGVPPALVARGGFRFRAAVEELDNPWELLGRELPAAGGTPVVPAIADENSARWILHLGLGDELELEDDAGRPLRLRLVGLLDTSIFQSELLVSEAAFRRYFPSRGGFSVFLVDAPPGRAGEVAAALEERLGRFGLDAVASRDRLAGFQAVEGMYLTTFQALGGLGLLLGTLGLGVVLARNVLERRGELAALRAFGYRRSTLGWMVAAENGFLLAVGIGIGTVAGLVAVAPHLAAGGAPVPWASLAATLAAVFAAGMVASAVAVTGALRTPLLPALKQDR